MQRRFATVLSVALSLNMYAMEVKMDESVEQKQHSQEQKENIENKIRGDFNNENKVQQENNNVPQANNVEPMQRALENNQGRNGAQEIQQNEQEGEDGIPFHCPMKLVGILTLLLLPGVNIPFLPSTPCTKITEINYGNQTVSFPNDVVNFCYEKQEIDNQVLNQFKDITYLSAPRMCHKVFPYDTKQTTCGDTICDYPAAKTCLFGECVYSDKCTNNLDLLVNFIRNSFDLTNQAASNSVLSNRTLKNLLKNKTRMQKEEQNRTRFDKSSQKNKFKKR